MTKSPRAGRYYNQDAMSFVSMNESELLFDQQPIRRTTTLHIAIPHELIIGLCKVID